MIPYLISVALFFLFAFLSAVLITGFIFRKEIKEAYKDYKDYKNEQKRIS